MDNSLHEKLKAIENSLPEIEKQLSEIDISKDEVQAFLVSTLIKFGVALHNFNRKRRSFNIAVEIFDFQMVLNTLHITTIPLTYDVLKEVIRYVFEAVVNKV